MGVMVSWWSETLSRMSKVALSDFSQGKDVLNSIKEFGNVVVSSPFQ